MKLNLIEPVDTFAFLPIVLVSTLYAALTLFRGKPIGREFHLGFLLAITCLAGFLIFGLSTLQSGMFGRLGLMIWSLIALPAAGIAFALGWSVGIISLKLGDKNHEHAEPVADQGASTISRRKFVVSMAVILIAVLYVPIDYALRGNTPRWVGASSTVTVNSGWMCITMRALYPYDWGDRYVPLFSLLLPPGVYGLPASSVGHPHIDAHGNLVFDFGPDFPDLTIGPEYGVYEYRSAAWIQYDGVVTDEAIQQFVRAPLRSHSIEELKPFLEDKIGKNNI